MHGLSHTFAASLQAWLAHALAHPVTVAKRRPLGRQEFGRLAPLVPRATREGERRLPQLGGYRSLQLAAVHAPDPRRARPGSPDDGEDFHRTVRMGLVDVASSGTGPPDLPRVVRSHTALSVNRMFAPGGASLAPGGGSLEMGCRPARGSAGSASAIIEGVAGQPPSTSAPLAQATRGGGWIGLVDLTG